MAALIIALVALSQVIAAAVYSVSYGGRYLLELAGTIGRASSVDVGFSGPSNGSIKLVASSPVRVLATYLISNGTVVQDYGGGVIDGELTLSVPVSEGYSLLVVMENGKFLNIPLDEPNDPNSNPETIGYLGYKLAIGHLVNYADYLGYGPIHTRVALSQPPGYADTGYRPILQGNVVFYFTGLTYGVQSGNYWRVNGEHLVVYPNQAILSTGVSQNPTALTQVLKVVRGSGNIEVRLRVSVEVDNTHVSQYYPRILVVYYVVPNSIGLQLPVAIFQPPAIGHEPWLLRGVLHLAQPGEKAVEYSGVLKLNRVPERSYVLIGAEVLSYGVGTTVKVSITLEE